MTAGLGYVVVALAALECVLLVIIVMLRVLLRRNRRRADQFRPAAELAVASYLAAGTTVIPATYPAERAIWRDVALEAMSDLSGSERAALAHLLDDLSYVSDATSDLRSRRRTTRRRGAETLAAIANADSLTALATGLHDRDIQVRMTCARALAEASGIEEIPDIITAVIRDVRTASGAVADVVLALGREHPDALEPLLRPDAPAEMRSIAMAVVSEIRLTQYAPMLRECLVRGDQNLAAVARGLGMIGDVEAVPALIGLAEDESHKPAVRAAAVAALGSIGDPSAAGSMERLVRHENWSLRATAAQSLSGLGNPGRGVLERAARSPSNEVREQVQAVLQS